MVNWKNKYNLPSYVELYLKHDDYDYEEGVISATRLMAPVRQFVLSKRHDEELEQDVSDMISSRMGTAIHSAFEVVPMPGIEKEIRLYHEIEVGGEKFKISGKFDMLKDIGRPKQTLVDIKTTSVWNWIFNSKEKDYIKQLSIYKYLGNKNGFNIGEDAEICMIFTDWNKSKAASDPDYPKLRVAIKKIKLWEDSDTEEYIIERLNLFKWAMKQPEESLPRCSDEELWKKDDKWAVMKPGRSVALKLCDTEKEARSHVLVNGLNYGNNNKSCYIQFRKGLAKRCNYCLARKWCDQCKELVSEGYVELGEEE